MLIDLDSRDLIPLERDDGELADRLATALTVRNARVVLSAPVIDELIEPMRRPNAQSRVMTFLNRLERLPHVWARTFDLKAKEVACAIKCHQAGVDYAPMDPFVESFVDTHAMDLRVARYYRKQPLAVIAWDLVHWERSTMAPASRFGERYTMMLEADRRTLAKWTQREYRAAVRTTFETMLERTMRQWSLGRPADPTLFADHLWNRPSWAPALRLGFAAWHAAAYDRSDKAESGDLVDLQRLDTVPYVDVFTCDGARRDLLRRLRTSPKYGLTTCAYWDRCAVLGNLEEVLAYLAR